MELELKGLEVFKARVLVGQPTLAEATPRAHARGRGFTGQRRRGVRVGRLRQGHGPRRLRSILQVACGEALVGLLKVLNQKVDAFEVAHFLFNLGLEEKRAVVAVDVAHLRVGGVEVRWVQTRGKGATNKRRRTASAPF